MDHINQILANHFSGEITSEENELLSKWIQKNPIEYATLKKSWNEDSIDFPNFDVKNAWNKIEVDLIEPKSQRSNFYWIGAAASIVLLVSSFLFFNRTQTITIANTSGFIEVHEMPDGSSIWMANNTQISYRSDFEERRDVNLKGTAFFEVSRNEAYPFKVNHEFGEIEVLGTGFNVNVGNVGTTVMVEHGSVACRNNSNKEVVLNKNESAILTNSEKIEKVDVVDENIISWKTGKFIFENDDIVKVLEDLNSFYKKEIKLNTNMPSNKIPQLTATFENQSLEEVIEIIALTCNLKAKIGDTEIILK